MLNFRLNINCKVWQNTPNSLIDFESDENVSLSLTITKKGALFKKGDSLNLVPLPKTLFEKSNSNIMASIHEDPTFSSANGLFLCTINPKKDIYEIELNNNQKEAYDIDDIPWIISRYVFDTPSEKGYHVHEGDLFKLGKFILKVRQIRLKKSTDIFNMRDKDRNTREEEDISKNILNPRDVSSEIIKIVNNKKDKGILTLNDKPKDNSEESERKTKEDLTAQNEKPTCRICLGDEYTELDPLINPCKCSGTMKYLHLNCLRQLIDSKIQKTVGDIVTVISFKTLACDICKSLFPENVKIKKRIYTIIDLHRPPNNYMIIEGIVKEAPDMKSIFVLTFRDGRPIKIGRASDADVRLSDISVSRSHAVISINKGNVILTDTKSKFGTLVNSSNRLCILPNKQLCIQKGNIFLKFFIKLKLCSMLSCYKPHNLPYKTYNSYFESIEGSKCQIKDVPNFLWTDTQIVSEYESDSMISKNENENQNNTTSNNNNLLDSRHMTGDITNDITNNLGD